MTTGIYKYKSHSDATKKKIGLSNSIIQKRLIKDADYKRKLLSNLKDGMLDKKHSLKTKHLMSKKRLERKKKLGYINSIKTRKKISEANKGKLLNWFNFNKKPNQTYNYNIQGHKSYRKYKPVKCWLCETDKQIHNHHYTEPYETDKVIPLCSLCHKKINTEVLAFVESDTKRALEQGYFERR